MSNTTKADKAKALQTLQAELPKGKMVYVRVDTVSQSGMSAKLRVYTMGRDEYMLHIGYHVALIFGKTPDKENRVTINGCGFDRVQHLVENLSYELYGDMKSLRYQTI